MHRACAGFWVVCFLALWIAVSPSSLAHELPVVTFAFPDMTPYLVRNPASDEVEGPIADRVSDLAAWAGLQIRWVGPLPRARIWAGMDAQRPICHPNARNTPDRAGRFKMTLPIFQEAKYRLISRVGTELRGHGTLTAMLADEGLVFGRLLGSSLNPELDGLITQKKNIEAIRGSLVDLLRMLVSGRVHYIVSDANDLWYALEGTGWTLKDFEVLDLPDLPRPQAGRIVCSQAISDDVIDAFNAAINALPYTTESAR